MKTFLGTFVIPQANCTSIVHIYNAMRALARVNNFEPFRHPPSQGGEKKKKISTYPFYLTMAFKPDIQIPIICNTKLQLVQG